MNNKERTIAQAVALGAQSSSSARTWPTAFVTHHSSGDGALRTRPASQKPSASTTVPRLETSASVRVPFKTELAAARAACRAIRDFLNAQNLSDLDQVACELALVEASNNAVLYSKNVREETLEILAFYTGASLELHVIDHTDGFDWPAAVSLPEPDAGQGRGLYIINALMDEVVYLRGQRENRLLMRKHCAVGAQSSSSARPRSVDLVSQSLVIRHPSPSTLGQELEIARKIQQSLLPRQFPFLPGVTFAGCCRSAQQVGGDLYDVLPLSESSALIVIADVMGKGVPAALFAATLRTLVRTTAEWTHRPGELLARINRLMFSELSAVDMFVTVQLAVADMDRRRLVVANAGHCPLLVASVDRKVEAFAPDGPPVGILSSATFGETEIPLDGCCCALLYTDGLTEARNVRGDFFGQDRLMSWLREAPGEEETAAHLCENLKREIGRFQSETPLNDDQTFLVLRHDRNNR